MGKKYYKKFSWWIPVLLTLFLGFWAVQISINQGKITDDIRNISMDINDKLSSAIGLINFEGIPSNGDVWR